MKAKIAIALIACAWTATSAVAAPCLIVTVKVEGDELFYAYMVDNQAIVILETIDAIRALTGMSRDAGESIAKTNAALGVGSLAEVLRRR